jgi:hypothetical protein
MAGMPVVPPGCVRLVSLLVQSGRQVQSRRVDRDIAACGSAAKANKPLRGRLWRADELIGSRVDQAEEILDTIGDIPGGSRSSGRDVPMCIIRSRSL